MPNIAGDIVRSTVPALAGGLASTFIADQFGNSGVDRAISALTSAPRSLNFNAGGLIGRQTASGFNVTPTAARQNLVLGQRRAFGAAANQVGGLLGRVRPGFGNLTEARVNAIQDARRRTIGDLRENLARRRVLGSSFAQDAETRAMAEFARLEEQARAQSFLEELDLTSRLLDRQTELNVANFQAGLAELNLEAETGANMAAGGAQVLSGLAQAQGNILADAARSRGELLAGSLDTISQNVSATAQRLLSGL